jgi:hypothetical protein
MEKRNANKKEVPDFKHVRREMSKHHEFFYFIFQGEEVKENKVEQ